MATGDSTAIDQAALRRTLALAVAARNPLSRLRAVHKLEEALPSLELAAVKYAREGVDGEVSTWEEIGVALGMTRQGAWDQFHGLVP